MDKSLALAEDILDLSEGLIGDLFDTTDEFTELFLDYVRAQDQLIGACFSLIEAMVTPSLSTEQRVRRSIALNQAITARHQVMDRMAKFGIETKPWNEGDTM